MSDLLVILSKIHSRQIYGGTLMLSMKKIGVALLMVGVSMSCASGPANRPSRPAPRHITYDTGHTKNDMISKHDIDELRQRLLSMITTLENLKDDYSADIVAVEIFKFIGQEIANTATDRTLSKVQDELIKRLRFRPSLLSIATRVGLVSDAISIIIIASRLKRLAKGYSNNKSARETIEKYLNYIEKILLPTLSELYELISTIAKTEAEIKRSSQRIDELQKEAREQHFMILDEIENQLH